MRASKYTGKHAYRGDIALNYERDRVGETVWGAEQEFVARWTDTLPANSSILDIPTGTGRFVGLFLQRNLHVRAMDISEDMLAEVRKTYSGAENLLIENGDAERLSLGDDAVDCVISWRLFHLIPMEVIHRILAEFRRVCRGMVVIQVFAVDCSKSSPSWLTATKARTRSWLRGFLKRNRSKSNTPWAHIPSFCHREEELLNAFGRAGFSVQEAHELEVAEGAPAKVYFLIRSTKPSDEKTI
ncbi:MAG TPA: methyltransferase domain-containing protein [Lacunisphaera sp.]|jgi:ubiquinone/menaquinone biosynthesis C-methylase UbiE